MDEERCEHGMIRTQCNLCSTVKERAAVVIEELQKRRKQRAPKLMGAEVMKDAIVETVPVLTSPEEEDEYGKVFIPPFEADLLRIIADREDESIDECLLHCLRAGIRKELEDIWSGKFIG